MDSFEREHAELLEDYFAARYGHASMGAMLAELQGEIDADLAEIRAGQDSTKSGFTSPAEGWLSTLAIQIGAARGVVPPRIVSEMNRHFPERSWLTKYVDYWNEELPGFGDVIGARARRHYPELLSA